MDALTRMQGHNGLGRGLTTFPDGDEAQQAEHAECLALEASGKAQRHVEGVRHSEADGPTGTLFVIWMPTE